MEPLERYKIKILTKEDLYDNYPFPYDFALILTQEFPTVIVSKSLKELLFYVCFLGLDENLQKVVSQNEFFNQDYNTFFCMDTYFIVKNGILYYLDSKSKIYFNLENIKYQDILISSVRHLVIQDKKKFDFISWVSIHPFLLKLKSSDTKSLCCFIKENSCMKNERTRCIKHLIYSLTPTSKQKKYSKQNILAILDLIGIDFNKANLITTKYISIYNEPSILIDFLKVELEKEVK